MRRRGATWIGCYVVLTLLPLVVALASDPIAERRSMLLEVGVACGFVALALLVLEVALVSRLRTASRPFGTDALLYFHRLMAIAAMGFLAAHPLLLSGDGMPLTAFDPLGGPWAMRSGAIAFWLVVLLVGTSVARRRFHLPYEAWQQLHGVGAVVIVAGATVHVLGIRHYGQAPAVEAAVVLYAGLFGALLAAYRVVRPLRRWHRPWHVTANEDVGGDTRLVRLVPTGPWRLAFEPGQFAWLVTGRGPFAFQQHPLSIASSAVLDRAGTLEFAIKALGDWSGAVGRTLRPGTRVWVDGPYGAFTPDRVRAPGFVFVAGGIGVSPMRAMLLTLRDRGDPRPVLLVLAARNWERLMFREELARLAREPTLRVVYVFEEPPADWTGERGFVTAGVLRRHLPEDFRMHEYFVCGPPPMMDALEAILRALGVPERRVHTERFDMV